MNKTAAAGLLGFLGLMAVQLILDAIMALLAVQVLALYGIEINYGQAFFTVWLGGAILRNMLGTSNKATA